tara:strand:+ start:52 stop:423 length:372 start_codon:yes stop_codon:yes gene_type:complete
LEQAVQHIQINVNLVAQVLIQFLQVRQQSPQQAVEEADQELLLALQVLVCLEDLEEEQAEIELVQLEQAIHLPQIQLKERMEESQKQQKIQQAVEEVEHFVQVEILVVQAQVLKSQAMEEMGL